MYRGARLAAPRGWDPEVELSTMPLWTDKPFILCKHYWQTQGSTKGGCSRSDSCPFLHSSAHMTPTMKIVMAYVERNEVIPGVPRTFEADFNFRGNYPAPWPREGVSFLNQDGRTYSITQQQWETSMDNLAGAIMGGPPQLNTPLYKSVRARGPSAPQNATMWGPGGVVHTNTRQGHRPRSPSPDRNRRSASAKTPSQNTYHAQVQAQSATLAGSQAPQRYISYQAEATRDCPPDMKDYAKWSPIPFHADEIIKDLRACGLVPSAKPKPAKPRDRSASRQRAPSLGRGLTSAAPEVMLTGLPDALHLDLVTEEHGPPKEEGQELVLQRVYHYSPAAPHNFTNPDIAACGFHRLRGHHGLCNI